MSNWHLFILWLRIFLTSSLSKTIYYVYHNAYLLQHDVRVIKKVLIVWIRIMDRAVTVYILYKNMDFTE